MDTIKVLMVYASALILLGVIGFLATGMVSFTALIPAYFGFILLLIALLAKNPGRKHLYMHVAVALGFLGFLGGVMGVKGFLTLIGGGEVERPAAVISQTIMAVLSLVFVIMCVKSFMDARKSPPQSQA
jgi:hypothetical protein